MPYPPISLNPEKKGGITEKKNKAATTAAIGNKRVEEEVLSFSAVYLNNGHWKFPLRKN